MAEMSIDPVLLFSRWLHLSAAIVAIGGVAFQRLAYLPGLSGTLPESSLTGLRDSVRKRWAPVVHACIVILLLTGGYNFVVQALPPKIEPMPYHALFGVKFLAAIAVFFIASILVGRGEGFASMRTKAKGALTGLLVLGAIIVLLSGMLNQVRSSQLPKSAPQTARGVR